MLAGDQLLTQIAGALKESVRAEDTVARLGGDEFAILVPRLDKSRDVTHLASKVLKAIAQPFQVEGGQVAVSASVGVALSSDSGNDSAQTGQMRRHGDVSRQEARQERLSRLRAADARRARALPSHAAALEGGAEPQRVRAALPAEAPVPKPAS